MYSALVVGGDGLIARALSAHLAATGWEVLGTTRRAEPLTGRLFFDLKDGFKTLPEDVVQQSKVVFVCAAVTGFAACAIDPEGSSHINVTRTIELGHQFMQWGARVVYLSSNAVFGGTQAGLDERAPTSAVTEYGRQKANCEAGLLAAAAQLSGSCAVVRLTKVVDRAQPLYSGWMQSFKSHAPAKAAADLVMCPVTTAFVVSALQSIGAGNQGGVYHLSGERDVTYYELASAIAAELGGDETVEKDWVRQRLGAEPSPAYSALSMAHTTETWGLLPQPLTEVAKELTGQE
jgi:dTDP-4-dehydrorhamnose reductase